MLQLLNNHTRLMLVSVAILVFGAVGCGLENPDLSPRPQATATADVPTIMGTPIIIFEMPTADPRTPTVSPVPFEVVLTAVVGVPREDALATAYAVRSEWGLKVEEYETIVALPVYPTKTPRPIGPPPANTAIP